MRSAAKARLLGRLHLLSNLKRDVSTPGINSLENPPVPTYRDMSLVTSRLLVPISMTRHLQLIPLWFEVGLTSLSQQVLVEFYLRRSNVVHTTRTTKFFSRT